MSRSARTPRRRMFAAITGLVMASTALAACGSSSSGETVINLYNAPEQNLGAIVNRCNQLADGKYRIHLNTLPRDADGQREQLVRRLAAGDDGMDILGLDVTWTAELAEAGWIREWTGKNKQQAEKGTLPAPLDTAVWHDKLYAAPYNTNTQLLWYRSDLVPNPPTTWDGLMKTASQLADAGKPHYVEVTGAQYEGLMVWFNSLVESAGGQILTPSGKNVSLGPPAETALKVMRDFARSDAADPSLTNSREQQVQLAVEGGKAAMEVVWPFVYASMIQNQPEIAKNFKWAPYPGINGPGRSPLGGANFAISQYSKHPQEAFQAALCLRDPQSQKIAAIKDGVPPTIESLYSDTTPLDPSKPVDAATNPSMRTAYPMKDAILDALKTAAVRPKTPTYQNLSTVTTALLSPPSDINPPSTLKKLRTQIQDALESKGVLP